MILCCFAQDLEINALGSLLKHSTKSSPPARQAQCNADRQIGRAFAQYSPHSVLAPAESGRIREKREPDDQTTPRKLFACRHRAVSQTVPAQSTGFVPPQHKSGRTLSPSQRYSASEVD